MAGEANVDSSHIWKKRKYLSGTTDANFQHQSQCIPEGDYVPIRLDLQLAIMLCKLPHNWFIIEHM